MAIKKGDKINNVILAHMGGEGPEPVEIGPFFAGKKVVLFSVPGAFTPTCSAKHLPGYILKVDEFFAISLSLEKHARQICILVDKVLTPF